MPAPALVAGAFQLLNKGLDVIFPDPTKRAEAKVLLQQAEDAGELQVLDNEVRQQQERTVRHANDMKSDSWLSKNIRPMTLIYLCGVYSILAISDGNLFWTFDEGLDTEVVKTFTIGAEYKETFGILLKMMIGFYVSGRTIEKATKIFKGDRE